MAPGSPSAERGRRQGDVDPCQQPCQLMAKPGSEADVFISLGCSPWDTENVITDGQPFISSQIPAAGGQGRQPACSLCAGSSGTEAMFHSGVRDAG